MTTPIDNHLRDVLGMLRNVHDEANTENVLNWATNLLATLQAPYNISLLTMELLSSPAVWNRPAPPLAACMRLLAMFRSAAAHFHAKYLEYRSRPPYTCPEHISSDLWANAVCRGLHHQPDRWKHAFVLVGALAGLQDAGARDGPIDTTRQLEMAVAEKTAKALAEARAMTDADHVRLAEAAITLAVAQACPCLLDTQAQLELSLDDLVPVVLDSVFHHPEGLHGCAFMGDMGADAVFDAAGRLDWPQTSRSFRDLNVAAANPLVAALGPVARVLALAVSHTGSIPTIDLVHSGLVTLAEGLAKIWGSNRLSVMEHNPAGLSPATQEHALPILFKLQRNILFACAVVMRAIVVRAIGDARLARHGGTIATMSLQVLHALSFISSREGNDKFEAYTATYLAALDLLARCRGASAQLLRSLAPPTSTSGLVGGDHASPMERTRARFYMFLAAQLAPHLAQDDCTELIVLPAKKVLEVPADAHKLPRMAELYEAAHGALLSVLVCPQHAAVAAQMARPYAAHLTEAFPERRITAEQFHVAFRAIVKFLFPPHCLVYGGPELASTLLEGLNDWAARAASSPPVAVDGGVADDSAPMTEHGVLVLAFIDSLSFVPVEDLEDWLFLAAARVREIVGRAARDTVRARLRAVLTDGRLDVERAAVAAAWWGTHGGQEMVEGEPMVGNQL